MSGKKVKRPDGRNYEDLRDTIRIEAGVLERADGSAYLEWGTTMKKIKAPLSEKKKVEEISKEYPMVAITEENKKEFLAEFPKPLWKFIDEIKDAEVVAEYLRGNKVYVAVYGPREPIPRHEASPYRAILKYRYTMSPFSVPDRKSPKPSRREIEISMVSRNALERVLFLEEFPMTSIEVFAEIALADAGTRVAALTAASVALADAGIPMRDVPAAVAVGRICIDEEAKNCALIADLNKEEEDMPGAVDLPMVVVPRREEYTLLQMDGRITKDELDYLLELGIKKAKEINKIQREALLRKYERVSEDE